MFSMTPGEALTSNRARWAVITEHQWEAQRRVKCACMCHSKKTRFLIHVIQITSNPATLIHINFLNDVLSVSSSITSQLPPPVNVNESVNEQVWRKKKQVHSYRSGSNKRDNTKGSDLSSCEIVHGRGGIYIKMCEFYIFTVNCNGHW